MRDSSNFSIYSKIIFLLFFTFLCFNIVQSIESIESAAKSEHFSVKSFGKRKNSLSYTENRLQKVEESYIPNPMVSYIVGHIICALVGVIFVPLSLIFLCKNERNYIRTCHRLDVELQECASLDPFTFSKENDGHLIFLEGLAISEDFLKDKDFPMIATLDAIKLIKIVEVLQWKQTEHNKHINYDTIWSEDHIDSTNFVERHQHENFGSNYILKSEEILAQKVRIGQYYLSDEMKRVYTIKTPVLLSEDIISKVDENFLKDLKNKGKTILIQDNYIYLTNNPNKIEVGSTRISFFEVKCRPTTLVAQQSDNSFVRHEIESAVGDSNENSCNSDRFRCLCCCCIMLLQIASSVTFPINEIFFIFDKSLTKEEIFDEITSNQRKKLFWLRLLGWAICCFAISLFTSPYTSALLWIPLFESLYSDIYGFIAVVFGLMVGSSATIIIICVIWIFHKPAMSLIIISFVVAVILGLSFI